jgi:hypothetical protein
LAIRIFLWYPLVIIDLVSNDVSCTSTDESADELAIQFDVV